MSVRHTARTSCPQVLLIAQRIDADIATRTRLSSPWQTGKRVWQEEPLRCHDVVRPPSNRPGNNYKYVKRIRAKVFLMLIAFVIADINYKLICGPLVHIYEISNNFVFYIFVYFLVDVYSFFRHDLNLYFCFWALGGGCMHMAYVSVLDRNLGAELILAERTVLMV